MNKPDDVSAEAWEMAEDAAQECFDASVDLYETGVEVISAQAVVARAIDAAIAKERERCAKIADKFTIIDPEEDGVDPNEEWEIAMRCSAHSVAKAIRNPSKP